MAPDPQATRHQSTESIGDSWYSPGRVMSLLWRYEDLVKLVGSVSPDSSSQHQPSANPSGTFEEGAAVKADLDTALATLEPIIRRVVTDYYVEGFPAITIAAHLKSVGVNRWFVDRARHRGIRQMALALHWRPKRNLCTTCRGCGSVADTEAQEPWSVWLNQPLHAESAQPKMCPACGGLGEDSTPKQIDDDADERSIELRERVGLIVARALHHCPHRGPPGYACPVIDCRSYFDDSGLHAGTRFATAEAA